MKSKTYSIVELNAVSSLLNKCKNDKELKNPSSILSIIRVVKNIQDIQLKYSEEQKQILELFEVPKVVTEMGANFDWSNMSPEVQDKIKSSLNELNNTSYEVKGFNKIEEEDFVVLTQGMDTQAIAFLWDYLIKE